MHAGKIWEQLSRKAKNALVMGERSYMTVRQELYDHGLIEDPDANVQVTTDLGEQVASHGRFAMCNTYDHLQERFMYFTECALASVEELEGLSRPPKSRLRRHRGIADKMLFELKLMKLTADDAKRHKCPRVMEALQEKTKESIDPV